MARVLVTGGAGFIGSHTVERLLRDGHTVTALDNLASGTWANLHEAHGPLDRVETDVRDASRLAAVVRDGRFDAVIHLAAWASVAASMERPAEAFDVNLGGTAGVLEAARATGVRRVVLASSAAVYGRAPVLPVTEDTPLAPLSPYAAHKAAGELLGAAYRAAFGVEVVRLRYFNVYGRRQPADSPYSGVVSVFAERLACGWTVTIYGDGEQTRDFIHVSDVARVNVLAALGPDPGGDPINVSTGTRTSVLALLAALRTVLRVDAAVVFAPERPGDVRHSQADITRLAQRLGYVPRVDLEAGLRDLVGQWATGNG
jgi:UDP-glucose 4-epimerase